MRHLNSIEEPTIMEDIVSDADLSINAREPTIEEDIQMAESNE